MAGSLCFCHPLSPRLFTKEQLQGLPPGHTSPNALYPEVTAEEQPGPTQTNYTKELHNPISCTSPRCPLPLNFSQILMKIAKPNSSSITATQKLHGVTVND